MTTEHRLIEIEIKLAHQDDLLETLNQMVYQQQRTIDRLELLCSSLSRHITQMQEPGAMQNNEPERPPHY
jgi:SlyX protein